MNREGRTSIFHMNLCFPKWKMEVLFWFLDV